MNVDLNMPVLIIDDHLEMLQIVRNLLKQLGLKNVDQSLGGQTAIEMLHRNKYDLVIADENIAQMGGMDMKVKSLADHSFIDTPFLLMMGQGKFPEETDPPTARLCAYIQTPFNVAALKRKLITLVGNF